MALLVEAGVDIHRPTLDDVNRAWDAMRRFAFEPAADVPAETPGDYDDGLFAQYGVFDWTFTGEHEFFELDMTRQFAVPAPGQPVLRQVHCTFRFPPTDEIRSLGEADLDSFEIGLEAFFDQALEMPGFARIRECGVPPAELAVSWNDL
ncbi:hypothetical protein DVA67_034390 [Solirubrobacter sp. CPCC 204708]|uniref:Uncharacterized protein n=1 Tax=Solirubrobacter deserti TaxID=2282478 RepID=A0ABT4RVE8_9ACTN|nr:hypothetical protein [Solirubrobacter deserti]MBE2321078.1 hypothetical protein [Solirubrobacter deserti]MDA0142559.1 hypothetical protein [Solirubrobacter deserti]